MFSYLNFKRIFTLKRGWTGILPHVRRAYTLCFDSELENNFLVETGGLTILFQRRLALDFRMSYDVWEGWHFKIVS